MDTLTQKESDELFSFNKKSFKSTLQRLNGNRPLIRFFSDIVKMPDLEGIVEYLKPQILNSYNFLSDEYKDTFSNETRRKIENIILRDFPKLLNNYKCLPLETRNSLFSDNKTYRDNLIENFAFLLSKLRELEESSLSSISKDVQIQNNLLKEYYGKIEDQKMTRIFGVSNNDEVENKKRKLLASFFPDFSWHNIRLKYIINKQTQFEKKIEQKENKALKKARTGNCYIAETDKNDKKEKIILSVILVAAVTIVFGAIMFFISTTNSLDKAIAQDHYQYQISDGVINLDNHANELTAGPLTQRINKLNDYQNPDYLYHIPSMTWKMGSDESAHIIIKDLNAYGCARILEKLPINTSLHNIKINQHPIQITDFHSVRNANDALCNINAIPQMEFDVKL